MLYRKTRGKFIPQFHICSGLQIYVSRYVAAAPLAQKQLLLTKGDNKPVDDIDLYQGLEWLERRHIVGKVRG